MSLSPWLRKSDCHANNCCWKQFGVSDFFKHTLKLSFAHLKFLYNFYELANALGDSVFVYYWLFGSTFSNDEEMKRTLCRSSCNWQHVHKLQKFPRIRKNVAIRSKCKSARNYVFHFHNDIWYCFTQNSQLIRQPWSIHIITKILCHGFQVLCDHARSACSRCQQFLVFCINIKNFLVECLLTKAVNKIALGYSDAFRAWTPGKRPFCMDDSS